MTGVAIPSLATSGCVRSLPVVTCEIPHRESAPIEWCPRGGSAGGVCPPHLEVLGAMDEDQVTVAVGGAGVVVFTFQPADGGNEDGDEVAVSLVEIVHLGKGLRRDAGVCPQDLDRVMDLEPDGQSC